MIFVLVLLSSWVGVEGLRAGGSPVSRVAPLALAFGPIDTMGKAVSSVLANVGEWVEKPYVKMSTEKQAKSVMDKCAVFELDAGVIDEYVNRPALQQRLRKHLSSVRIGRYLVVVGPRGGGKSTVVSMEVGSRRVVYVQLSAQEPSINDFLRNALGIEGACSNHNIFGFC
ncbi:hypothetical protein B484DRAFT_136964 [Ochromonadaceae sp. CCMP2298]|nr:hypothetical protein B484DRAFT_136964 [Ochromonadaceae sp. CCMP2298]